MQRPASAAREWWHWSAATPVVAMDRDHKTHPQPKGSRTVHEVGLGRLPSRCKEGGSYEPSSDHPGDQ